MSNTPEPNDPVDFDELPDDKPKRGIPEEGYRWHEVWSMVLASPGIETFERITAAPGVSRWKAVIWLAVSVLAGLGVVFVPIIIESYSPFLFAMLWGFLTFAVVLVLLLSGSFIQLAAKLLGGAGSHRDFMYSYAAFRAPMFLISTLVMALTGNPIFMYTLTVYDILLTALAVKAINRLSWLRTVVAMGLGQFLMSIFGVMVMGALLELFQRIVG